MKKILIIEDEQDTVRVLKLFLEKRGYEVIYAYDGEDGLKKIFSEHPDLVILDIMLPKLNGISLGTKMRSDPKTKDIPLIVITGKGYLSEFISLKDNLKLEGYFEKPFPIQMLYERIKNTIGE